MSVLADPTCGFLPVHLYEGPDLDDALDICRAINSLAMCSMGLGCGVPELLRDVSLREMLDALETVERWNDRPRISGVASSVSMVPAERLIAAAYTLVNFHLRPQDEGTDVLVRFDKERWGETTAHFLAVCQRQLSEMNEAEDEDEAS